MTTMRTKPSTTDDVCDRRSSSVLALSSRPFSVDEAAALRTTSCSPLGLQTSSSSACLGLQTASSAFLERATHETGEEGRIWTLDLHTSSSESEFARLSGLVGSNAFKSDGNCPNSRQLFDHSPFPGDLGAGLGSSDTLFDACQYVKPGLSRMGSSQCLMEAGIYCAAGFGLGGDGDARARMHSAHGRHLPRCPTVSDSINNSADHLGDSPSNAETSSSSTAEGTSFIPSACRTLLENRSFDASLDKPFQSTSALYLAIDDVDDPHHNLEASKYTDLRSKESAFSWGERERDDLVGVMGSSASSIDGGDLANMYSETSSATDGKSSSTSSVKRSNGSLPSKSGRKGRKPRAKKASHPLRKKKEEERAREMEEEGENEAERDGEYTLSDSEALAEADDDDEYLPLSTPTRRKRAASNGSLSLSPLSAGRQIRGKWRVEEDVGGVEHDSTLPKSKKAKKAPSFSYTDVTGGKHIKGQWTSGEDNQLKTLVERYGAKKWPEIAQHMVGRTGKQCRERWVHQLDPAICRDPFTPEEDAVIVHEVKTNGNLWAEIAKALPGRTANSVKNRWYSSLSRSRSRKR